MAERYATPKPIRNEEHLTMVDRMRAQMQEPQNIDKYMQDKADQRKAEYDEMMRRQKTPKAL